MRRVDMHEAKSTLSALVAAVEHGTEPEIVLMRNGQPAARIIPLDPADKRPILGLAKEGIGCRATKLGRKWTRRSRRCSLRTSRRRGWRG